jgi:predicted nucleic acid-binding protein
MRLVVDTNILLSFFRDNPTRFIILNAELLGIRLFTPEYAIEELKNNKVDILKYSKLDSLQFDEALSELSKFIEVVPKSFFDMFEPEAKKLIHEKDVPIFALAISLDCAIWSNEPGFKKQFSLKVFNSKELRRLFKVK